MNPNDQLRNYLNVKAAELTSEDGFRNYMPAAAKFKDRVGKVWQRGALSMEELDAIEEWLSKVQYYVDRPQERPDMPNWPRLSLDCDGEQPELPEEEETQDDDSHVPVPEVPEDVSGDGASGGDAADGTVPALPDGEQEGLSSGNDPAGESGHVS